MSEVAIDSKLTRSQIIQLEKRKKVVEYSSRLKALLNMLEYAGFAVLEIEQKHTLVRGLAAELYVTIRTIICAESNFQQAVSRYVVRELRLQQSDIIVNKALVMRLGKKSIPTIFVVETDNEKYLLVQFKQ